MMRPLASRALSRTWSVGFCSEDRTVNDTRSVSGLLASRATETPVGASGWLWPEVTVIVGADVASPRSPEVWTR